MSEFYTYQKVHGPTCGVGRALVALPPAEVVNLKAALALSADELQHQAIEAWLRQHEHPVGKGAVSRHRNGVCHCDR